MKNLFVVTLFLMVAACAQTENQPSTTTFILVRHAEKANDETENPPLSEAGLTRAAELQKILAETSVDAVYSTSYLRTQGTVKAIADSKGLDLQPYKAMNGDELNKMLQKHKGGTVLISGHSNTTPWTANYFLGSDKYPNFEDSDYDNLMIVSVVEVGNASVIWLSFGEATP